MNLSTWFNQANKDEVNALKDALKVSPSYISQIRNGRAPSIRAAKTIVNITNTVTPDRPVELHELRPDIWDAPVEQQ